MSTQGDYIAAEIAGSKVFAVNTKDGLRALRNVCRHSGARLLAEVSGRCTTIRCSYHQWVWNEDGSLLNVPWWGDDPEFDMNKWKLDPVEVYEWRGLLFVALSPETSLDEQLGALIHELSAEPIETFEWVREERLVCDSNWKIYTNNFVEVYQIPGIHPTFQSAIEFEEFETIALDNMVRMTAPPKDDLFYRGRWF